MDGLTEQTRTRNQVREHYEIEKELAARLRNASREERRHLYSSLYDDLLRRIPHHPMLLQEGALVWTGGLGQPQRRRACFMPVRFNFLVGKRPFSTVQRRLPVHMLEEPQPEFRPNLRTFGWEKL